jgi:hypothetical protein
MPRAILSGRDYPKAVVRDAGGKLRVIGHERIEVAPHEPERRCETNRVEGRHGVRRKLVYVRAGSR